MESKDLPIKYKQVLNHSKFYIGGIRLVMSKAVEILKKVAPPFYKLMEWLAGFVYSKEEFMDADNKR